MLRQWHPTPVLLPGKSHGRRSLVGCNPWGLEESDMTERFHFHFSLSCIEEGNGNPLQCSCLENPRDSGAWWAAIYGVTQSRKWLKGLSSSSLTEDEQAHGVTGGPLGMKEKSWWEGDAARRWIGERLWRAFTNQLCIWILFYGKQELFTDF